MESEADQRHVREMLKGPELERANHSATPCAVERKNEATQGGTKARESTDADRNRLRPSTSGTA